MAKNAAALVLSICVAVAPPAGAEVTLLSTASIPGTARDHSGLTTDVASGIPSDLLGSFGSGITYAGSGNRYIAIDDRGPQDGKVPWRTRFATLELQLDPA